MWHIWGRGEVCTGFWWGNLREGDHWGDPDVDGSSGSGRGSWGLDGVGSGQGQVAGTCEYGEEPLGSKNAGNFLTSCRSS
jgi:hypothetical protein